MKVCYLSGGTSVPTIGFRLPFFEALRKRGHQCVILHAYPARYDYYRIVGWRVSQAIRKVIRFWHLFRILWGRYDVVVLETGLFHTNDDSYEKHLRRISSRLIYEIDDAVFLLFPKKTENIARDADHVIAGNHKLANWTRQFNTKVSIIPTCIDDKIYVPKQYNSLPDRRRLVIGWIGSSGNVRMLQVVASSLRKLASSVDFDLHIITNCNHRIDDIDLAGVNVKWIEVNRCDVVGELHQFDIGIMPLPSGEPWMEYKCNAKMIQYMTVGIPAIGSAVGYNNELISHGENGMLANSEAEWESCIRLLCESSELRQRLGEAGRQTALIGHTVASQIDLYEQILIGDKLSY